MKIQLIPRYTASAASSRLRVFRLADAVNRAGLAETVVGPCESPDVVYMQKVAMDAVVTGHKAAIYDVDDQWDRGLLAYAANHIKTFTTDTPEHGAMVPGPFELLPDMVDYDLEAPLPAAPPSGLAWFGNFPNFASVARLMAHADGFCQPVTICDSQVSDWRNIPWAYLTFADDLRRQGTCLLSHSGADRGKSANKLLAAVSLGVPCIVNDSPAYEALMRAVGLDWAIVNDGSELKAAWDRLQDEGERQAYLAAAQPYIWERYRPEAIARRFMEICEGIL